MWLMYLKTKNNKEAAETKQVVPKSKLDMVKR